MRSLLLSLAALSFGALVGCGPSYLDSCESSADCGPMQCLAKATGTTQSCSVDAKTLECIWVCTTDADCKDAKAGASPMPKCVKDCAGRGVCGHDI
jgi:hypothetical protein